MFDGFNAWLNDPARSNAVGLIGVAKLPAGPKGSFTPYAGSGVGVSRYSKNPEMAWLWIQWAVAKGTQEAKILSQYQNYPTRSSVLGASEVASALQTSSFTVANLVNEVWREKALTTLLGFPKWLAASNIVAIALNTAWTGTVAPKLALANAQTKLEQLGTLTF
jgi:ABC-type glycerol-3-phosphate transport system substrate-binding protein